MRIIRRNKGACICSSYWRFWWVLLRLQVVPKMLASSRGNSTHIRSLRKFEEPNARFGLSLQLWTSIFGTTYNLEARPSKFSNVTFHKSMPPYFYFRIYMQGIRATLNVGIYNFISFFNKWIYSITYMLIFNENVICIISGNSKYTYSFLC